MRLLSGGATGSSTADMWSALRGNPWMGATYGDQLAILQCSQDYAAPSNAHRKRILRPRPEVSPAGPARPIARETLTPDLDFLKSQERVLRKLGVLRRPFVPGPRVIDRPHAPVSPTARALPLTREQRQSRADDFLRECKALLRIADAHPRHILVKRKLVRNNVRTEILSRATQYAKAYANALPR